MKNQYYVLLGAVMVLQIIYSNAIGQIAVNPTIKTFITEDAKVRDDYSPTGNQITVFLKGTQVRVSQYFIGGYWKVTDGGYVGYVNDVYLEMTDTMMKIKSEFTSGSPLYKTYQNEQDLIARRNKIDLIARFGPSLGEKISNHELSIGMTKEMVMESIGMPEDTRRTTTARGVDETLIYPKQKYLHFVNNILTAISE